MGSPNFGTIRRSSRSHRHHPNSGSIVVVKPIGAVELSVLLGVAVLLIGGKNLAIRLQEAFDDFRGGPGSPSHPLPADDSKLLNRRRNPPQDSGNDCTS